jgi:hypothetical protein
MKQSCERFQVKHLLFASLMLTFLRATAWSDLPPPRPVFKPSTITVAHLSEFPGFKFSYTTDAGNQPKKFFPLRETQVIWDRLITMRLFVEGKSGERFEWASVNIENRPKTVEISILDVHRDEKRIKVTFKMQPDPASEGKSAENGASPMAPFMLSGFSLGALVLLMRGKRAASL